MKESSNMDDIEGNLHQNDDCLSDYKKEMLASGLCDADVDYLVTAYKNLEDAKFIRMHCTSCDKHIGSAPNDLQNRYEHPLLKVLVCGHCFEFYSSGDFEKDEDGSELYCRWCGEGGQVFCCTTCPFVFCKKCIRRNLGRGIAKTIENSDNWMCFACDPSQIARLRATYWAIQKYSDEVIKKSEFTGDKDGLNIDGNICCAAAKRRSDIYTKLMQPPKKKQKQNHSKNASWKPSLIAEQPEDEVICTPDILPLDESPPPSPIDLDPIPPLMPVLQPKKVVPVPVLQPPPSPPLLVQAPTSRRAMNITELQQHLQTKYSQIILTPRSKTVNTKNQTPFLKNALNNNGNYKIRLSSVNSAPKTTAPVVTNSNYVALKPIASLQTPISTPTSNSPTPMTSKSKDSSEISKDWFDQALVDCAELTEYISTKISSLSSVHLRAYKSEILMEELHNTFQTYMHVAFEKINKIRRVTQSNYEADMEKTFRGRKVLNPYTLRNAMKATTPTSSSESSKNSKKTKKTKLVSTKNVEPEEVLFDMDVTNASDEESGTPKSATPINERIDLDDSDSDVQEIIDEKSNEVIQIVDSDDEVEIKSDDKEKFNISDELLDKIKTKFDIQIPSEELANCLQALIILNNKKNQEVPETPSEDVLKKTEHLRQNVESIRQIEQILKDEGANIILSSDEETNNNKDKEDESKEENAESDKTNSVEVEENTKPENLPEEKIEETVENEINKGDKGNDNAKELDETENQVTENQNVENAESETENQVNNEENVENAESDSENQVNNDENMENVESDSENQCAEDGNKFLGDIEEILGSSVVLKKNVSFGDEFNKFVCENDNSYEDPDDEFEEDEEPNKDEELLNKNDEPIEDNNELVEKMDTTKDDAITSKDDEIPSEDVTAETTETNTERSNTPDSLKDSINVARELDMIPEYVNEICNKDNGSLSLPPDSITSISATEIEMLMQGKSNEQKTSKNSECDELNSEILALQQMAENCVTSVDVHKNSTECKG